MKRNIRHIIGSCLLILILTVPGCLQSLQEAQRLQREKREKLKEQERTFQRPNSKPIVSKDGLKFETEHYILTFAENVKNEDGYEITEERNRECYT